LHENADHRAIAVGHGLIDEIDVPHFGRFSRFGLIDEFGAPRRVRFAGSVNLVEERHIALRDGFRQRVGYRMADDGPMAN
jgi:hypothetical protein